MELARERGATHIDLGTSEDDTRGARPLPKRRLHRPRGLARRAADALFRARPLTFSVWSGGVAVRHRDQLGKEDEMYIGIGTLIVIILIIILLT